MRAGTKFILFVLLLLAILGAWLAWMTTRALRERGADARSAASVRVC